VQGSQALILRFRAIVEEVPSEPDGQMVEKALDWTEGALVQGRDHTKYDSSPETHES
jgi:hypothetical protein